MFPHPVRGRDSLAVVVMMVLIEQRALAGGSARAVGARGGAAALARGAGGKDMAAVSSEEAPPHVFLTPPGPATSAAPADARDGDGSACPNCGASLVRNSICNFLPTAHCQVRFGDPENEAPEHEFLRTIESEVRELRD